MRVRPYSVCKKLLYSCHALFLRDYLGRYVAACLAKLPCKLCDLRYIKPDSFQLFHLREHLFRHIVKDYLPFVHVRRNDQPAGSGNRTISFLQNGGLDDIGRQMMTLVLYCEGWENEGRKIMISRAGRIRIKRMMR